jgi:hypothetical protein
MKLVIASLAVAIAIVSSALASSCSVEHRSDAYACSVNTDCTGGRICDNGFCVVRNTIDASNVTDGPKGDSSNNGCPSPCSTCNVQDKTCTINCQSSNCTNAVTCPAGYKCDIMCNTDNACRNGIDCRGAASCTIACASRQACETVQCGSGPCDVTCAGVASCRDIECNNSCACDVRCTGSQSCDTVECTSLACESGSGCTSVPAFCHACL